jgi:probable F420-dependent oxidoreductase
VRLGVHLPQYGRAASAEAIAVAARQAEELGFSDVWVSDHLAVPSTAPYPPPFLYEAVVTLTWAAAATTRVGLGTSVLVLPYRHPVHAAKELASLDALSSGRLTAGVAAGFLQGEFAALNVPFPGRGARLEDGIAAMRACWRDDPCSIELPTVAFSDVRVVPKPAHEIPIWIGGNSDAALARAVRVADGWHGISVPPERVASIAKRIRAERDDLFTVSMRTTWDGSRTPPDEIRQGLQEYREAGVEHILITPVQPTLDDWRRSVDEFWALAESFALPD